MSEDTENTTTDETESDEGSDRRTKYEYPPDVTTPEQKKKYRRDQRRLAQGKEPRERKPKTDADGNPVARKRREKPAAQVAHNFSHEDLIVMFAETENGAEVPDGEEGVCLEFDGDLEGGYAIAISGSTIEPSKLIKKYIKRFGEPPLRFNVRGTDMVVLGPTPEGQGPTPAEAPEAVTA